jgi:hypothetical protein
MQNALLFLKIAMADGGSVASPGATGGEILSLKDQFSGADSAGTGSAIFFFAFLLIRRSRPRKRCSRREWPQHG